MVSGLRILQTALYPEHIFLDVFVIKINIIFKIRFFLYFVQNNENSRSEGSINELMYTFQYPYFTKINYLFRFY